ncbi:SDR family NAD(P)-dependent oxidoreductase [Sphingobium sp. DEHP117]|uniref:SDR family NAD(P)-dependent oxidoreductase n=1 Tax=Sphingobium sp. DEHP117 TaxID=2993436 RepID=UPI0027D5E353|nr:SDR family NAD(P)-dependent oxidoreductase [Sphingobium sp. DEHP117]MDQ4420381.1 SDR family NAD(P)-dependent oxidoreductase [Sphingobium sp. DEHP117]
MSEQSTVRLDDRVAVVTGAGNGLGREYALALAERGAAVVVNDLGTDVRGKEVRVGDHPADRVVEEIRMKGGRAVASKASCSTYEGGQSIIATALDAFGRIDILVHNAGFLRNRSFADMTEEQFRTVIDVHLMGAFYTAQPAFRAMMNSGYGRIVLIGSAAGEFGSYWQANYSAAKAGVVGFMNDIANEGAEHGILVNTVLPLATTRLGVEEDDWAPGFFDAAPAGWAQELLVPDHGRDFVASMVVWLASENCKGTQNVYSVAGGRFARVFTGVTHGWLSNFPQAASPEDIEANLAEIEDLGRFTAPKVLYGEFEAILQNRANART